MDKENKLILYKDENGRVSVNVRFADEDVWLTQALDDQILRLRKNILEGSGTVSHQEALGKAEREFEICREREMRLLESDFDKAVKRLKERNGDGDLTTED